MNIWIILVILEFLSLVIVIADILQNGLSGKVVRQGKYKYIINIKKGGFLQENGIVFEPVN